MVFFFFFNDTATTEIYPLSLHDALPIWVTPSTIVDCWFAPPTSRVSTTRPSSTMPSLSLTRGRSEEHTSELQSHSDLVCRLLLEKKKKNKTNRHFAFKIHEMTYLPTKD